MGAVGQTDAADAIGEAGIVLDSRARGRLGAGSMDLDDQCSLSLRGSGDRRRQARRPGAEDDQVVVVVLGAGGEARAGRQFGSPPGPCRIVARAGRITSPRGRFGIALGGFEAAAVGEQRDRLERGPRSPDPREAPPADRGRGRPSGAAPHCAQGSPAQSPQPLARDGQTASPVSPDRARAAQILATSRGSSGPPAPRRSRSSTLPSARAPRRPPRGTRPSTMRQPPRFQVGPKTTNPRAFPDCSFRRGCCLSPAGV
jgi:hypothetical protein